MDGQGFSDHELRNLVKKSVRIKTFDLNGDGTKEIVAKATDTELGCGAHNCPFWIFQRVPHGYKLISSDQEGIYAVDFTLEKRPTKGFRDIIFTEHDSAFQQILQIYQFKNGIYKAADCYLSGSISPAGEELESTVITKCGK